MISASDPKEGCLSEFEAHRSLPLFYRAKHSYNPHCLVRWKHDKTHFKRHLIAQRSLFLPRCMYILLRIWGMSFIPTKRQQDKVCRSPNHYKTHSTVDWWRAPVAYIDSQCISNLISPVLTVT